jgi:hypothetical protein
MFGGGSVVAFGLAGCATAPDGTVVPPDYVAIASAVAKTAATAAVIKYPKFKTAFQLAEVGLTKLINAEDYDRVKLAEILASLNIAEFQGATGTIWISGIISIWEAVTGNVYIVDSTKALGKVITAIRDGFRVGLAMPASRGIATPVRLRHPVKKSFVI